MAGSGRRISPAPRSPRRCSDAGAGSTVAVWAALWWCGQHCGGCGAARPASAPPAPSGPGPHARVSAVIRATADGQRSISSARTPTGSPTRRTAAPSSCRPATRAPQVPSPAASPRARRVAGAPPRRGRPRGSARPPDRRRGARAAAARTAVPVIGLGRAQDVQRGEVRREQQVVDRRRVRVGEGLPEEPTFVGQRLQPEHTGHPLPVGPFAAQSGHVGEPTGHGTSPGAYGAVGSAARREHHSYRRARRRAQPTLAGPETWPDGQVGRSVPVTLSDRRAGP